MEQTVKIITAPDDTQFELWCRDSIVHIDLSITLANGQEIITDNPAQRMYSNTLFHPKNETVATQLIADVETAIIAGEHLGDLDTTDNCLKHSPVELRAIE